MSTIITIAVAAVAALVSALAVSVSGSARRRKLEDEISSKEADLKVLQARLETEEEAHRRMEAEIRQSAAASLEELRKSHDDALKRQIEAVRAEMKAGTEEILRKREEELARKAQETFSSITGGLEKDLKNMKEAFESNKKTQNDTSSAMKESLANAIRTLEAQTRSIGDKADNLADALRGQNKMQGCWGETILHKLLENEGFTEGVSYDREETLRDAYGNALTNEDTGNRMRPDYIIHFPDDNDIIIDSKVSLAAYSDFISAKDEQARKDASRRNLAAIREQVRRLSGKNYSSYLKPGRKMLEYSIMFIPNYAALQLAYNEDPSVWRDAFSRNVLITTEETLMPFLRMINIAWRNMEQVRNQKEIIANAQRMIDRVYDFALAHDRMGKKLDEAKAEYDKCDAKLKDSGQSIIRSAREVLRLGVPENPRKVLPDV